MELLCWLVSGIAMVFVTVFVWGLLLLELAIVVNEFVIKPWQWLRSKWSKA